MICPNCGRETPDGMAFCFNCGAKLTAPNPAEQAAAEAAAQAQREAEEAAAKVQREAQEAQARAQREAEEAAAKAQREAQEAQARAQAQAQQAAAQAQAQAQQAQQQYSQQQYGPQQYGQQQYGPQQYGPQQYGPQQYGPQQYAPQPQAPKQPSAFDKLLTDDSSWLANFYKKSYNSFLAIVTLIGIAYTGIVFGLLFGKTGYVIILLFLEAMTLGAAVVGQLFLSKNKALGWILTLVAGGLRWLTVLISMIGFYAGARKYAPANTFNSLYSIFALLILGALIAGSVLVFIKNMKKK